ncbi:hypothetical protein PLAN_40690 [Planktothrix rubescens CCAP 1459/22]|uniref:Uncharacterized protein n=1 Tax=Planktothrix rubescens CCAP 1459/22 TaxID=329571 RepID=A0A6J7ZKA9_PLARU|nr:hypothetical protein PLAN_40690 [Planktothrix rubescens NIVA-CYA 18]
MFSPGVPSPLAPRARGVWGGCSGVPCYINNFGCEYGIVLSEAPLADWGGSELIIRLQTGSIPVGRIGFHQSLESIRV